MLKGKKTLAFLYSEDVLRLPNTELVTFEGKYLSDDSTLPPITIIILRVAGILFRTLL